MLQVIGVSTVTACCDALNIIIVAVFLLHLVVAHQHLGIDAGRVLTRTALVEERHGVLLLLLGAQIGQKAQFVKNVILIQIVQLAWYFTTVDGDQSRMYVAVFL